MFPVNKQTTLSGEVNREFSDKVIPDRLPGASLVLLVLPQNLQEVLQNTVKVVRPLTVVEHVEQQLVQPRVLQERLDLRDSWNRWLGLQGSGSRSGTHSCCGNHWGLGDRLRSWGVYPANGDLGSSTRGGCSGCGGGGGGHGVWGMRDAAGGGGAAAGAGGGAGVYGRKEEGRRRNWSILSRFLLVKMMRMNARVISG